MELLLYIYFGINIILLLSIFSIKSTRNKIINENIAVVIWVCLTVLLFGLPTYILSNYEN